MCEYKNLAGGHGFCHMNIKYAVALFITGNLERGKYILVL